MCLCTWVCVGVCTRVCVVYRYHLQGYLLNNWYVEGNDPTARPTMQNTRAIRMFLGNRDEEGFIALHAVMASHSKEMVHAQQDSIAAAVGNDQGMQRYYISMHACIVTCAVYVTAGALEIPPSPFFVSVCLSPRNSNDAAEIIATLNIRNVLESVCCLFSNAGRKLHYSATYMRTHAHAPPHTHARTHIMKMVLRMLLTCMPMHSPRL